MDAPSVGLAVAFAGGMLSFLSPCVFPVSPSCGTFITWRSLDELTGEDANRKDIQRNVLIHAVLFIIGFSIVFAILGATATFLGQLFFYASEWIARIGGILLIVFGLYLLGVVRLPGAGREWRL